MGKTTKSGKLGVLDLFGQVPVTWPEVYAWIEAVAGIAADSWRAPYYIEHWNVPAKVASAKLAGTYDAIVARRLQQPGPQPAA